MIVWVILNLLVGFFCALITYITVRADIKKTFPKSSYIYRSNKESDKNSFIKKVFKNNIIKYLFSKSSLMYYGFNMFISLAVLKIIAIGLDSIISYISKTHSHIDHSSGDLNVITFLFFTSISVVTTWVILESHFDDIKEEINTIEYNRKLKLVKEKYNIEPSMPSWEIEDDLK